MDVCPGQIFFVEGYGQTDNFLDRWATHYNLDGLYLLDSCYLLGGLRPMENLFTYNPKSLLASF